MVQAGSTSSLNSGDGGDPYAIGGDTGRGGDGGSNGLGQTATGGAAGPVSDSTSQIGNVLGERR